MSENTLTFQEIQEILPQKYPFLLIDKVIDYKENESLVAVKNITGNEWVIDPAELDSARLHEDDSGLAIFPEALIIEAAIQAAIILYHVSKNHPGEKPIYLLGKIDAEFKDSAGAGDQLIVKVYADKLLRTGGFAHIKVFVREKEISNIQIFFSVQR